MNKFLIGIIMLSFFGCTNKKTNPKSNKSQLKFRESDKLRKLSITFKPKFEKYQRSLKKLLKLKELLKK